MFAGIKFESNLQNMSCELYGSLWYVLKNDLRVIVRSVSVLDTGVLVVIG